MLADLQTSSPGRRMYTAWLDLLAPHPHSLGTTTVLLPTAKVAGWGRTRMFSVQGLRSSVLSQRPQVAALGVTGSLPLFCNQSVDQTHHSIQAPNTQLPSESDALHYPSRNRGSGSYVSIQNVSIMCAWSHLFTELFLLPGWCSQTYLRMPLTPLKMTSVCSQLKATGPKLCASEEDSPSLREISCQEHPENPEARSQSQETFPLKTPQPVGGSFATS